MKILFFAILVIFFTQQGTDAGVVRKPPAFATPVYSNSYLPAAMQVIFHAVDQLKNLQAEESASSTTMVALPTTSPHAPGQHQPSADELAMQSTVSTAYEASTASIAYTASTLVDSSADSTHSTVSTASEIPPAFVAPEAPADSSASATSASSSVSAASADTAASEAPNDPTGSTTVFTFSDDYPQTPATVLQNANEGNHEKPKVVEEATAAAESGTETTEGNYATPEVNHEVQEPVQEVTESNQEVPEKNEGDEGSPGSSSASTSGEAEAPGTSTALPKPQGAKDSSEEDTDCKSSSEESKEQNGEVKHKSSSESKSAEDDSSSEEEDDEIRFTLIGEKVAQVPRPSLSSYLKKTARAPLRGSVQELAILYDALSKDARKQGLGKYSGYSDEVLQTLESSVEGGVGPQLQVLLEKARDRNELTRDDAKAKLASTLKKLADPASMLSRDLRRLVPLRYIP